MNNTLGLDDYGQLRKEQIKNWWSFTQERFEPVSHFLMIGLFIAAHYLVANASRSVILEPVQILWVTLGTTCFFMKLRFYDEIKDFDVDVAKKPHRPLPRGLLKHFDMKKGVENCIILEIIFFATCGLAGFIAILMAISYSLLMYKEFFIPKLIRPHLTTYATSHTVVTLFISLAIFSAMSRYYPWSHQADFYYFSLISWLLFNIFEIGRKVYQSCEEVEGTESYSNVWGRWGAFILVFIHAMIISVLSLYITTVDFFFMQKFMAVALGILFTVGMIYLFTKTPKTGALFRMFSSLYIVIIYSGFIANYIMRYYL